MRGSLLEEAAQSADSDMDHPLNVKNYRGPQQQVKYVLTLTPVSCFLHTQNMHADIQYMLECWMYKLKHVDT